ncbi:hypothetical protein XPN_4630, partial [Xanthomonas arboricola pv. pruni MAFF 301427]
RGGGSRPCRRARPRLCRGGLGGAHARAAVLRRRQGDQGPHRRLGATRGRGFGAGAQRRQDHGRRGGQRATRHRHHGRDFCSLAGTVGRHRAGQPDHHAHGRNHPAECRAGGRSHCRRARDGRAGGAAHRCGGDLQDRRTPGTAVHLARSGTGRTAAEQGPQRL